MKKQIVIGVEFFDKVIEGNHLYIDKTLLIKELLENRGDVTLITRPRRFGKTLNMSMLRCFFDAGKNNRHLFEGLKIMEHADIVEKHMGQYPVVFFTLKDVEEKTFDIAVGKIKYLISEIYGQNMYICESGKLDETDKEKFMLFRSGKASESEMKSSLRFLTSCLYAYYGKRAIVLIDEYDAPINNSLEEGYYREMVKFMRGFLGSAFKSNEHLEFGVLTGVQRISKEGLVSGFNNPKVCGITDDEFAGCYGFTEEEVKSVCGQYGYGDRFDDVKRWYDGYRFGRMVDMYNPWSITNFLRDGRFRNYWANTASLTILRDIFFLGSDSLKDDMAGLLTGKPVQMRYDEHVTYPIVYKSNDAFWSMLLNAGYLKPCTDSEDDRFFAELVNREVKDTFARCVEYWLKDRQNAVHMAIQEFAGCLLAGDAGGVGRVLNDSLLNNPSCHDFKEENSYHMFIYGILLAVSKDCAVLSNRETGKGRADCVIKPADKSQGAVVVEFKHVRDEPAELRAEAQRGLEQIEERVYVHELKQEGYKKVLLYGIAFHKKYCEIAFGKTNFTSETEP
ncbi:MAG: ATP-binding protein [Oscillospiraceae bacterium]|nr:ATP-binding protein [Oscillospiraceae bacterium]